MPSLTYAPASLEIFGGAVVIEPIRLSYSAVALGLVGMDFIIGPDLSSGLSMDALKLNRIPRNTAIVDGRGFAESFFQLLYQRNCEGTEAAFQALSDQVSVIGAIVAGLQEAQRSAAEANQGVVALNSGVSLSSSRTNPVDGLLTATSDGVVTISAHDRVYTVGTTEETVSVNAGSVSGFAQGLFVRVYYNDAARAGGTVAFIGTTDEITQVGDIHVVGGITIPSAGSPPSTGTGTTPPGYVREQSFESPIP